jgi:hypothetical protein
MLWHFRHFPLLAGREYCLFYGRAGQRKQGLAFHLSVPHVAGPTAGSWQERLLLRTSKSSAYVVECLCNSQAPFGRTPWQVLIGVVRR